MSKMYFLPFRPAFDSAGISVPGSQHWFTLAGTNTPSAPFADAALTTPLENPLPANGIGYLPPVYLDPDVSYRVRIYDANAAVGVDTPLEEYDPYVPALANTDILADLASAGGAGLVEFDATHSYSAGTLGAYLNAFGQRPVSLVGTFALNDLGATTPANGIFLGVGGNSLSFRTRFSNPSPAADTDNQRATALIASTTSDDGNSEEQTLCILTTAQTGYAKVWATSTAFSVGDNIRQTAGVYRCITAGTSAASGTGPSGTGTAITDGTCVWKWINHPFIDAKLGLYNEIQVLPGAGSSWAQANNLQVASGVLAPFIANTELDLDNNCGIDSELAGGHDKHGLWIKLTGTSRSTTGLTVTSLTNATPAVLWGAYFGGDHLASQAVIGIDASAPVGIGIGYPSTLFVPTFTTASIKDGATAPIGLDLSGTYSNTPIKALGLRNFANDAAAAAASPAVPIGGFYRNGSVVMVRVA